MAHEARAPGRPRRHRTRADRAGAVSLRPRMVALHTHFHCRVPQRPGGGACGARGLVPRAPAAARRDRRARRAVSRRARAVARSGDHQRRRSGAREPQRGTVGWPGRSPRRVGRSKDPRHRVRAAGRAAAGPALCRDLGGDCAGGRGALHVRSRVSAARPFRAARRLPRRGSRGPLPHRGDAGECDDSTRRRPDDCRPPFRFRRRPGVADGTEVSRGGVRESRAGPRRQRTVRGDAVRPRRAGRLLRRSGRRALHHVHAEGRRSAVRAAARARVPLPRVHRPAAAEGGGRRRHRGPQRHRDSRARVPHDGVARRSGGGVRQTLRGVVAGRDRRSRDDREFQGRAGRLLSPRARRPLGRARAGVSAVHDRRARGPAAGRFNREARPRYERVADRGSLRRGAGGR